MKIRFLLVMLALAFQAAAFGSTEVANRDQLRQEYGLTAYAVEDGALSSLKIAVLDNGFQGFVPGKGLLPETAELVEGAHDAQAPTPHGLGMAEIVWAMTGQSAAGPKFYLVNSNGYSNLKDAVAFVIKQKVDIVLYAQVWPFGDNFDGQGFINKVVDQATSAGILWINAAGNFGSKIYNGSVQSQTAPDGWLRFNGKDSLQFVNQLDANPVNVILSWTDWSDSESYNAVKDLDLYVYNSSGNLVGSSELIQSGHAPPGDGTSSQLSSYSREEITLPSLDRGTYQIKVRRRSDNFTASDRFRVALDVDNPTSIVFTDHTSGDEVMVPADNPSVFTVGENTATSSVGPTADGRAEPLATAADATVSFTDGTQTRGSSNAAAILAGAAVLMRANCSTWGFTRLSTYASEIRAQGDTSDLRPISPAQVSPVVQAMVPSGGTVMIHANGHLVVLTPVDPIDLPIFKAYGAYRLHPDDVMVISPLEHRWYGFPKALESTIQTPLIEFRQIQNGLWVTPAPAHLGC